MDSSPDDFVKTTRHRQPLRVTRTRGRKKLTTSSASSKDSVKPTKSTRSKVKQPVPVNQTCPCCGVKVESDFSVHVNFCLTRFSKSNQEDSTQSQKTKNKNAENEERSKQKETNERCIKCKSSFSTKRECSEHIKICRSKDDGNEQEVDAFKLPEKRGATLSAFQLGATKKKTKKKKEEDEQDAELQLALALSASLSQKGVGAPQPRTGKDKRAKKGDTLLKFRSKDSRKAAITERLGMVLMENSMEEESGITRRSSTYCSSHLKELKQPDTLKWKLAGESLDNAAYHEFYVGALRDFVIPQSKPYQPQFRSWTQIPGREHTLLSQQIADDSDDEDSVCTQDVLEDLYDISDVHSMLQQTLKSAMEGPESPEKMEHSDDTINKENQPPDNKDICGKIKKLDDTCPLDIGSDEEIVPCSTQKSITDSQTFKPCTSSLGNTSKKLIFADDSRPSKNKISTPVVSVPEKEKHDLDEISASSSSRNISLSDTICLPSGQKEDSSITENDDTILVSSQKAIFKPTTLFSCESASNTNSNYHKVCSTQKSITDGQTFKPSTSSLENTSKKLIFADGSWPSKIKISTPVVSIHGKEKHDLVEISASSSSRNISLSDTICLPSGHKQDSSTTENDDTILVSSQKAILKPTTLFSCESASDTNSDYHKGGKTPQLKVSARNRKMSVKNEQNANFSGLSGKNEDNFLSKSPMGNYTLETSKNSNRNTRLDTSECNDFSKSYQEDLKSLGENALVETLSDTLVEEDFFQKNPQLDNSPKSPEELALPIASPLQDAENSRSSIFSNDTVIQSPTQLNLLTDSKSSLDDMFERLHSEDQKDSEIDEHANKSCARKSSDSIDNIVDEASLCRTNHQMRENVCNKSPSSNRPFSYTKEHILLNWYDLWKTKQHSDLTINCKDKKLSAHVLILKTHGGRLWGKCWDADAQELDLTQWHSSVVDSLLCVLYCGQVNTEDRTDILKMAQEYDITALVSGGGIDAEGDIDRVGNVASNCLLNKVGETTINSVKKMEKQSEFRKNSEILDTGEERGEMRETSKSSENRKENSITIGGTSRIGSEVEELLKVDMRSIANTQEKSILSAHKLNISSGNMSAASLDFFDLDADSDDLISHSPAAPAISSKEGLKTKILSDLISKDSDVEELTQVEAPTSFLRKRRLSSNNICSPISNVLPSCKTGDGSFNNPFDVEDTSDEPATKRSRLTICDKMSFDLTARSPKVVDRSPEVLTISSDDSNHSRNLKDCALVTKEEILSETEVEAKRNDEVSSEENLFVLHPLDRSITPNRINSRLDSLSTPPRDKDIVTESSHKSPISEEMLDRLYKPLLERCRELEEDKKKEWSEDLSKLTGNEEHLPCDDPDTVGVWDNSEWGFEDEDCLVHYDPTEDSDKEAVPMEEENEKAQRVKDNSLSPSIPTCSASTVRSAKHSLFQESESPGTFRDLQMKVETGSRKSPNNTSNSVSSKSTDDRSISDKTKNVKDKGKMVIDDLNLEDSIIWRAENEPQQTPVPKTKINKKEKITPLPDYKNMATPALKMELGKYGLKQLSRKQATKMLSHIYEQLHPVEPKTPEQEERDSEQPGPSNRAPKTKTNSERENVKKSRIEARNDKRVSSEDESSDDEVCLEETIREHDKEFEDVLTQTSSSEVNEAVLSYISRNRRLHENILQYEPIWLDCLHTELKEAGIKCKMAHLMALFDNECIIYRISQQPRNQNRRRRKKASPKKNQKKTKS